MGEYPSHQWCYPRDARRTGRTILVELPELANLAAFLPADGCARLTGPTIAIDGDHALANEARFTRYLDSSNKHPVGAIEGIGLSDVWQSV